MTCDSIKGKKKGELENGKLKRDYEQKVLLSLAFYSYKHQDIIVSDRM